MMGCLGSVGDNVALQSADQNPDDDPQILLITFYIDETCILCSQMCCLRVANIKLHFLG